MEPRIKKQELIQTADDLVELNIIDWNRINGTSRSPLAAMRDISSWLIGRAAYTIIECDLHQYPVRDDFPEWIHVGHHVSLAKLYWNCFHATNEGGELILSDEPDFYGTFKYKESEEAVRFFKSDALGDAHFWGDFGKVSASAFAQTAIRKMEAHDMWVSVLSSNTQVVIEALESLRSLYMSQLGVK